MAPARGRKWCGFRLWPKPVALPKPLDLDVLSASVRLGRLAVLKLAEALLKAFFSFFSVKACRSSGKGGCRTYPRDVLHHGVSASVRLEGLAVLKLAVKARRSSGKGMYAHTHATCCTMVFPRPCVWKGWLC